MMFSSGDPAARPSFDPWPALRRRAGQGHSEEGAALMMVLLSMLVASALSLLVLGTIVSQGTAAVFDRKNVRAIHAAEAGVDVALARIRSATTPDPLQSYEPFGDRTKLPCNLQGLVQGSPGTMSYDVEIWYYQEDPVNKDQSWREKNANRLTCTQGSGTSVTPRFALLKSDGIGDGVPGLASAAGDRRLETVYDFQLTNQNIAGGVIKNYQDTNAATQELCWDAGAGTPAAGGRLKIETCDEELPQQLFAWQSDFNIALAQTVKPGDDGLCVEVGADVSGTRYAVLQPCVASAPQKFGFNNSAHFLARTSFGDWCPTQPFDNARGSYLVVTQGACGEGQIPKSAWQPSPLVGAGSVGNVGNSVDGARLQWVNYAEFGRCFDISNWSVGYVSMISYPCKQIPGESVGWNQTLEWDGSSKQLFTRAGYSGESFTSTWGSNQPKYCVTAPTSTGGYVQMRTCGAGQQDQQWTVNRELPGDYTSSYTVVDHLGRCMAVGPRNTSAPDSGIRQWSSIVSAACNGSGQQKWNAPPDPTKPVLRDTRELNG